ncbi:MMPL family transporter [Nocardia tengchongensis]|uniref:MMPL family transporter n=1 Tax=Nocardia tengchongensis TaxID=2055889 RepID=UPI0036A237E7
MFERLGYFIHHRRLIVLAVSAVIAVLSGTYGLGVFGDMVPNGFEARGSDSRKAAELADKSFAQRSPDAVIIYRSADRTVDDPAFRKSVEDVLDGLPATAVTSSVDYWRTGLDELVSHDRHATYALLNFVGGDDNAKQESYLKIKDKLSAAGLQTLRGGNTPAGYEAGDQVGKDLGMAEGLSFPVLFIFLVIVFGGFVAASLPLVVGGLSILGSMAVLRVFAQFTDISVFAMSLVTILGLAVAIDYGLFIVSRYREEMEQGRTGGDALARTLATAGRTVAVSGVTVAVALASMSFFPFVFLKSMAYGGVAAVLLSMFFSLVALPAALSLLGHRINALSLWKQRSVIPSATGFWYRLAQGVMRRPVVVATAAVALLLVLASPLVRIEFGVNDARQLPDSAQGRQAFNMLEKDFPSGAAKTIDAVVVLPANADTPNQQAALADYTHRLAGVAGAGRAEITGAQGTVARISVAYEGVAVSKPSRELLHRLRDQPNPTGASVYFGGETATYDDTLNRLGDALPAMLIYIAVTTYLLLFLAFGSVLLPLKAIVMNLLSLSATFGVLVWIFQDGHFSDPLGFQSTGNIEPNMPIMLFALIFGLSMDYEVFLLSRVREQYDALGDPTAAVATGVQRTGRLITSAALLMCVPLAAMASSKVLTMILFGVGMVVAIVLDATVVRILLVPAIMRLLGHLGWWAPGPLRRLYDRFGIRESDGDIEIAQPAGDPEREVSGIPS